MSELYFPSSHPEWYPHPRTRLFALLQEVKAAHPEFATRLDALEYHARAFFDNVWVSMEPSMAARPARPAASWQPVTQLHELAQSAT